MSLVLEFGVAGEQFALGEILAALPEGRIEAERIVPAGGGVMPTFWVREEDGDSFESVANAHPVVEAVTRLDATGDATLYRLEWRGEEDDLLRSIAEAEGSILAAVGDDEWWFRLRLPDRDALSVFHEACTDRGLSLQIERAYGGHGPDPGEHAVRGERYDLTEAQREALLLGLREGYFETPRESNLAELATEFDISQQALSSRIRRGTRRVLVNALFPPTERE